MNLLPVNIKASGVIILLLATTGLFTLAPRYEPSGPEMLPNGSFQQGFANWTLQGDKKGITASKGVVVLTNRDTTRAISLRQIVPISFGLKDEVMLRGEISTKGVAKGPMPWHKACFFLVGRTGGGTYLWNHPHMVTTLTGDNVWHVFSKVFSVLEGVSDLEVGISLNHASGVMMVRDLSLKPVREREGFHIAAYILLSCWGFVCFWVGIPLLRQVNSKRAQGVLICVVVCIFLGLMMPGSTKEALFAVVQDIYAKVLPGNILELQSAAEPGGSGMGFLHFILEGIVHFTLFACLAFLIRRVRPGGHVYVLGFYLMLFAATTEVIQFFTIDRGPTFGDWFVDVMGLVTGLWLITFIRQRKKEKG